MTNISHAQKLVVANWKSNFSWNEAQNWAQQFRGENQHQHTYVVCAPFPLLGALQNESFTLGVQDLSPFEAGAYTGAVSPTNLQGLGIKFAILGHSERRKYFQETSELVAKKVEIALAHDITPIVCVDRDQFSEQANTLGKASQQCFIAYEPIHAISTFGGQEDPLEVTLEAIEEIHSLFQPLGVLYGGSVSPENSLAYLQNEHIAGVLVGGSSLKPEVFAQL